MESPAAATTQTNIQGDDYMIFEKNCHLIFVTDQRRYFLPGSAHGRGTPTESHRVGQVRFSDSSFTLSQSK